MMMDDLVVKGVRIHEHFDRASIDNIGRPMYWNLDNHIVAIEQMICADEIETALKMCDQIPAFYRDNYPSQLTEIKNTLYKNLYDGFDYASDFDEANYSYADALAHFQSDYTYPRSNIIVDAVTTANEAGQAPWICELSSSHGWLPLGLAESKFKFNFFAKNLNQKALDKIKGWLPDGVWSDKPAVGQTKYFVFYEALEHCMREQDLLQSYKKLDVQFDKIFLSTPYGCLGHGLPNWRTRRLGHVRGYTVAEFLALANEFFPGYDWTAYKDNSMVLVGSKT